MKKKQVTTNKLNLVLSIGRRDDKQRQDINVKIGFLEYFKRPGLDLLVVQNISLITS